MSNTRGNKVANVRVGSARNVARNLLKKSAIKNPPIRINELVSHLKQDYELIVKEWLLSDEVSGFLIQEKDFSAIAYNKNHHVHRQRFTVAHEIGHLLLGHINFSSDNKPNEDEEKEAQIFASELLMPLDLLKNDLKSGCIDMDELAKKYWVSKEAIGWRIQDPHVLKYLK